MAAAEQSRKPMLQHALDYLALGYPVFPVCSPLMGAHQHRRNGKLVDCPADKRGKNPMVGWKRWQSELPTVADVRDWWERWPTANIGMATGELSGVIVLDCDSGEARQLALGRGGLEKAPAVWTGTPGGIHFWMKHPGYDVHNFAKDIPGTDFRGDGGYVLLPPSVHRNHGTEYRWNEHTLGRKLPPVPEWLADLFKAKATPSLSADGPTGDPLDVDAMLGGFDAGNRDTGLFKLAARFRHDDQPLAYAEALIQVAAGNCRPPFDVAEAVEKVRYVYGKYEAGGVGPSVDFDEEFRPPDAAEAALPAQIDEHDEEAMPWKVYDIADFLDIEFPPVEWRVEGFLRERAILFSFGAPGSIKTFVATDAALAIASGDRFLGKFACQQGRVLIVQEDTLASDYQQAYLRPMMRARGLSGADLRGQLFVAPQAEFALDQNERLQDLCRWLDTHKPDLLILDAFYLMYSGRKEDLLNVMKLLKKIRNKYNCSIWIIDHNRKGQGDASGENPIDRLINGREKSAAVDVVMESRPVKGEQGSAFLEVLKLRGAKMPEVVRITYADGAISIDGDDEVTPKGAAQTVYEWLCREGASRDVKQIMRGCDLAERTVRGAVSDLHSGGLVRPLTGVSGKKNWLGVRRSDAEPEPENAPTVDFDADF